MGLEGALLIAHPELLDPNFRRTVIYLLAHDPETGAYGLVINRDLKKTVGDLIVGPGNLGPLRGIPVFWGGPVSQDRLTFAAFEWQVAEQTLVARMNVEMEEAKALAKDPNVQLRAFVGYAGWGKDQLEGELKQQAWVVQKPDRTLLEPVAADNLWQSLMHTYGPWFRLLAEAPDDPSLN